MSGITIATFQIGLVPQDFSSRHMDVWLYSDQGDVAKASVTAASRKLDFTGMDSDAAPVRTIRDLDLAHDKLQAARAWPVFRDVDPRAVLLNSADAWIQRHVCPHYDNPWIDMDNDALVLKAASAIRRTKPRATGSSGHSAGPTRPKRTRKLAHGWF